MTYVQLYTSWTLQLMEGDLRSFEKVVAGSEFEGKLGVAMVTNACAGLNLFGWLIHQKFDLSLRDNEIFEKIIQDQRFFKPGDFINKVVLYKMLRCAVVHQFYPAGMGMVATDSPHVFLNHKGKLICNAMAFYRQVFEGLKRVEIYIGNLSGEALNDLDLKLTIRIRMDDEVASAAKVDVSGLPTDLGKGGAIERF